MRKIIAIAHVRVDSVMQSLCVLTSSSVGTTTGLWTLPPNGGKASIRGVHLAGRNDPKWRKFSCSRTGRIYPKAEVAIEC